MEKERRMAELEAAVEDVRERLFRLEALVEGGSPDVQAAVHRTNGTAAAHVRGGQEGGRETERLQERVAVLALDVLRHWIAECREDQRLYWHCSDRRVLAGTLKPGSYVSVRLDAFDMLMRAHGLHGTGVRMLWHRRGWLHQHADLRPSLKVYIGGRTFTGVAVRWDVLYPAERAVVAGVS